MQTSSACVTKFKEEKKKEEENLLTGEVCPAEMEFSLFPPKSGYNLQFLRV